MKLVVGGRGKPIALDRDSLWLFYTNDMLNGIKRVLRPGILWSCLFRLLERARTRKGEAIVAVK